MKNVITRMAKIEKRIGINKKFTVLIRQIDEGTLQYRDKLYKLPEGISIGDYLKKKFAGRKIILDDIYG